MSKITESAKGKPCLLRIPNVCNHNRESTVHCHIRLAGICGMGQKPIDLCGVRGCSDCHNWLDRRDFEGLWEPERSQFVLEGQNRTLTALDAEGLI